MTNANILVVEDEAIVAKDLQNRLKKFGYKVCGITSSGQEAINKAREIKPDLILMDVRLKGQIDGIKAAEEIHKYLDVPVIYLTAYADENTLERAKITDPFGYLLKPFKERELQTSIEIALTKHSLEKQLKSNKKWLATLLNSISDGVIASDMNQLITFMNPVAEKLTGWRQEEALGKNIAEIFRIVDAKTRQPLEIPLKKVLQSSDISSLSTATRLIAKNGTETPIDDSTSPIKDDQDNITGAVLVFRDVTERQQAIEARQEQIKQEQLVAQLEQLNQLKNDFLDLVSHQLRSPLYNIKGIVQTLEISITPHQKHLLSLLEAECDREMELINDLLDLQKLENSSYFLLAPELLLLQQWLPWLIEPFQIRTKEHQQTLQLNLSPNQPALFSDRNSLERILVELLNNACKYTPLGGEIILNVSFSAVEVPQKTIITVSNSAHIPATELPRIFEKFYRIPNNDLWNQGGTGLGLAIVQKLTEQLQGSIQVESTQGWTRFTLILSDLELNS
ncbi:response regulator [Nostoc sp. FACHB-152]|uniref:hybrid sensor histidine kinase/response regulator n=1 Tax=unclassified Nostoc TaxID=2593658 RepID=UPI0016829C3A|nr:MULTISPECIES: response regulator [unclassified Nostoc]MBD2448367.1 response regulator [Nostoc sp. FACHB-152]MBD2469726.1 response regulator [Nostoc sp. FACHB-145]